MKWPVGDREEAWDPDCTLIEIQLLPFCLPTSLRWPVLAYGHPATFSWGHLSAPCNCKYLRTSRRHAASASAPGSSGGTLILSWACISTRELELWKGAAQPACCWPMIHLLWGTRNQTPATAHLERPGSVFATAEDKFFSFPWKQHFLLHSK